MCRKIARQKAKYHYHSSSEPCANLECAFSCHVNICLIVWWPGMCCDMLQHSYYEDISNLYKLESSCCNFMNNLIYNIATQSGQTCA